MKHKFTAIALSLVFCASAMCACEDNQESIPESTVNEPVISTDVEETEHTTENTTSELAVSADTPVALSLKDDTYTELEHKNIFLIEAEKYDACKCSNTAGTLASANCIGGKILSEVYPDDGENTSVLELFDPADNTCKTVAEINFSAEYGTYSCVTGDRYFSMITAEESDGRLLGKISTYDTETDEFTSANTCEIHNIVQYITPYDDKCLIFMYYEADTQDRVIMRLDLAANETAEIYRESNTNEYQNSPVAITVVEDDIVLVLQYIKDGVYHTQFEWISPKGELLRTEEPDFYRLFDDVEYPITDFEICGNYYYLKTYIQEQEKYFIFKRDGDSFHIIVPAICSLNSLAGNSFSDEKDLLFYQNEDIIGHILSADLKNDSLVTYEISPEFLLENEVKTVKRRSDNDLMIFYDGSSGYPECRIVPDFTSIKTVPHDASLYYPPTSQDAIDMMKENNFLWRFIYN